MGPDGFISCFDHLMPEAQIRRKLILKGGPGVGKSTFMRRLHTELGAQSETSTLYFCSGDPDSLDAVALHESGLLILDGTAPHIIDPVIPGARDTLINLGICLDEEAMRPRLPHIKACMADHAACSRRARAMLKAACVLEQDNAALIQSVVDDERLARMTQSLIQSVVIAEAQPTCMPTVRPVITDAMTWKGELCLITEGFYSRVIRLVRPAGMDLTSVLRQVSAAAQAAGYGTEEHLCPVVAGRLRHVGIPALSTLITTGDALPSELTYDFSACVLSGSLLRHECALEQSRAAIQLHIQRAVHALHQAKQLHDELESFYVPNMDFKKWQSIFDETLRSLCG